MKTASVLLFLRPHSPSGQRHVDGNAREAPSTPPHRIQIQAHTRRRDNDVKTPLKTRPRLMSMMDKTQENLSRMTRGRAPSFMQPTANSRSRDSSREREEKDYRADRVERQQKRKNDYRQTIDGEAPKRGLFQRIPRHKYPNRIQSGEDVSAVEVEQRIPSRESSEGTSGHLESMKRSEEGRGDPEAFKQPEPSVYNTFDKRRHDPGEWKPESERADGHQRLASLTTEHGSEAPSNANRNRPKGSNITEATKATSVDDGPEQSAERSYNTISKTGRLKGIQISAVRDNREEEDGTDNGLTSFEQGLRMGKMDQGMTACEQGLRIGLHNMLQEDIHTPRLMRARRVVQMAKAIETNIQGQTGGEQHACRSGEKETVKSNSGGKIRKEVLDIFEHRNNPTSGDPTNHKGRGKLGAKPDLSSITSAEEAHDQAPELATRPGISTRVEGRTHPEDGTKSLVEDPSANLVIKTHSRGGTRVNRGVDQARQADVDLSSSYRSAPVPHGKGNNDRSDDGEEGQNESQEYLVSKISDHRGEIWEQAEFKVHSAGVKGRGAT